MTRFIKIYILFSIVFLCASCGWQDNPKDRIQKVSARISPILDTISLDYAQYVNYNFTNYTGENIAFYINRFSPDSLLYTISVQSNVTTGRVEDVFIPCGTTPIPRDKEEAIRRAAKNDMGDIEQILNSIIRFREAIGSEHIYYLYGEKVLSNKISNYDLMIGFRYKRHYYLLTHFRNEDDIPAEKIRVTERWTIGEIAPPDHR